MTFQPPDDATFFARMESAKEKAEDMARLERARAGLETGDGNAHDYLIKETDPVTGERKKKGSVNVKLSALDIALQNETYRAAYEAFGDFLKQYERATETALTRAEAALDDMMNRAVSLPGIGPVFRNINGDTVGIDGKLIDATISANIQWPDDAPSYEEYLQHKQAIEDIRRYQTDVLGAARDRYEDPNQPMTSDEFEQWQRRIRDEAPSGIKFKAEGIADNVPKDIMTTVAKPSL